MSSGGGVTNVYPDADVYIDEHNHEHFHSRREYHSHIHYDIQPPKRPRVDVQSQLNKISNDLKEGAKKDTRDINTMAVELNRQLNAVQFQITTLRQARQDADTVSDHRSDELRRINETPGAIAIEDVFKLAKERAIREANSRFDTDDMRSEFIRKNSKIAAVTGDPGVGKTTFTKILTQGILTDSNRILPGVIYVFYIQYRYMNYSKECNVLQFLVKSAQCNWKPVSKYDLEEMTEKFRSESDKCIFIFDGLDEAIFDLSTRAPFVSLHDSEKAEVFVKNILAGKLFPNAFKLFTCRTKQLFELHSDCRPFFILQILGISREAQLSLSEQICGGNSASVISHLKANPDLFSLCNIPINCILIMFIINKSIRENNDADVNTMTGVMVLSLQNYLCSEHIRGKVQGLNQLAELAYNGILQNKVVFDKKDLDKVHINDSTLQTFLTTSVTETPKLSVKIYEGSVRSNFTHLTWEEFFCAIHIINFLSMKAFKDVVNRLHESHFEVVARFLYGLCNRQNEKRLQLIFGKSKNWAEKKEVLIQNAIQRFPSQTDSETSRSTPVIKQLLSLFSRIKEMSEPDVIARFDDKIPSVLVIRGDVLPSDVLNLAFILQGVSKPTELHVGSFAQTRFLSDSMEKLTHVLLPIIRDKANLKATRINVSFNPLSHDDVAKIAECLNKISRLVIRGCGISTEDLELLRHARDGNETKTEIFGVVGIPDV